MCEDSRVSPLTTIAREITSVVEALRSGAVGVEGMADSFAPLPTSPHLGPVAPEFLEQEYVDFVGAHRLEESGFGGAFGLEEEPTMVEGH